MCRHGFETPLDCALCKDRLEEILNPRCVYVTRGESLYHFSKTCRRLELRRERIRRKRGTRMLIDKVQEDNVKSQRVPCSFCCSKEGRAR